MANWNVPFKLGIPTYELNFDSNPNQIQIEEANISVLHRNVAGDLLKSLIKGSVPTIKLSATYMTDANKDLISSLIRANSFLSFMPKTDMNVYYEPAIGLAGGQSATMPDTSIMQLAAAYAALGNVTPIITVTGVFIYPNGSGINYLGAPWNLNATTRLLGWATGTGRNVPFTVYVSYTYVGWLVSMDKMPVTHQAGWVDKWSYDFSLTGV